jgi:hypothetical protein
MNNLSIQRRQFLTSLVGAAAVSSLPRWAYAQAAYPNKPVRVIVPFAAGARPMWSLASSCKRWGS